MKLLNSKYVSKEIINVCFVTNEDTNVLFYKQIFNWIKEYLNLNIDFVTKEQVLNNFESLINPKFNFYFVDYVDEYNDFFAWSFYSARHEINNKFKLVFILKKQTPNDYVLFKNGADDIVYDNNKFIDMKWKLFSLLRRLWDYSHKETTLIHNGVIIDLLKRIVIQNNKEINITKKEFQLLEILVNEFNKTGSFVSKTKIFKQIYKSSSADNTRLVDQLIFRLKSKFDKDFFEIEAKKGIKIK